MLYSKRILFIDLYLIQKSLAHEIGFSFNFTKKNLQLYISNQFKIISTRSNKDYSGKIRKRFINKNKYEIAHLEKYKKVIISGDIITFSHELINSYKDDKKPTLFLINSQIQDSLNENILGLPPGQDFKVESNQVLNTISILEGKVNLILDNHQKLDMTNSSNIFYTADKNNNVKIISNISHGIIHS